MHFLPKGNISSKRQFSLLSIKHVMPFIIMVKILLFIDVSLTQREQALNTPWSRLHHSFVYLWSPTILLYMWSPTMPCSSTVIKTDIASSQIFCRGQPKIGPTQSRCWFNRVGENPILTISQSLSLSVLITTDILSGHSQITITAF